jgi:hypothetical protein
MRRLGPGIAALATVVALAPSAYAVSSSQPATHPSGGSAAVAAKKKCKKGFKLNRHGRCVRKSGSSPLY